MVRIVGGHDCGNAPKKLLLRDFNIAFANGDIDTLLDNVSDDVCWTQVGSGEIVGKEAFAAALAEMTGLEVTELVLQHIITHGNVGSVNGVLRFKDGKAVGFCDVYRFSSHAKDAKIKEMTSYVIPLEG